MPRQREAARLSMVEAAPETNHRRPSIINPEPKAEAIDARTASPDAEEDGELEQDQQEGELEQDQEDDNEGLLPGPLVADNEEEDHDREEDEEEEEESAGPDPPLAPAKATTLGRHPNAYDETPFTEFELHQQGLKECRSAARSPHTWIPDQEMERNLIFVWVGPHTIPARAIYAIASGALVYGPEWRVLVFTDNDVNRNVVVRTKNLLAELGCGTHATLEHHTTSVAETLDYLASIGLKWPEDKAEMLHEINRRGGKENIAVISDFVKAALTYQHGGVYMDMDTFPRHPILRPTLAPSNENECHYGDDTPLTVEAGYFPVEPFRCLATGLYALPKEHGLLRRYLAAMPSKLEFDKWGVIGPRLFMQTLRIVSKKEPDLLWGVFGQSVQCLLCIWTDLTAKDCTNYSYLSFGSTKGRLDETSRKVLDETFGRHCQATPTER